MTEYQALEPTITSSLGTEPLSFDGSSVSFFTSTSFLYTLAFVVIVVAASYRYSVAGMLRMQATEEGIRKSKEEFKRVTYGLLGVFGLWLILATVNKDMLTGDVGLSELKATMTTNSGKYIPSKTTSPSIGTQTGSGNTPKNCTMTTQDTITAIKSGNVCGGTTCNGLLTTCKYKDYLPELKTASGNNSEKLKMLIVIMCKESGGNSRSAPPANDNGTYDCGLMQVNKKTPCTQDDFNPATNIQAGASIFFSNNPPMYGGVPITASTFAAYNAGNAGANSQSNDCNSSIGFTSPVPKWVCPINAGDMCAVKSYACTLNACVNDPSLNGL